MKQLVITATLVAMLSLATAAHAAPLRYVGKAHSYLLSGTRQMRTFAYATTTPGLYTGTIRCRSLTPGARCLARRAPIALQFTSNGGFAAMMGGGLCRATGSGSPFSALSGTYGCTNGDRGWFYFRRLF
jgi:hypothetical protein